MATEIGTSHKSIYDQRSHAATSQLEHSSAAGGVNPETGNLLRNGDQYASSGNTVSVPFPEIESDGGISEFQTSANPVAAPSSGGSEGGMSACVATVLDDCEDSEFSDVGASDPSDFEDDAATSRLPDESMPFAQADPAATRLPPPLSLPPASYPEKNLPPRTGISIPMASPPNFIRAVPKDPEPLYNPPDNLFDDIVRQEADRISKPENVINRIVFDSVNEPPDGPRAGEHQSDDLGPDLVPYYVPVGPADETLVFESRFESGNLRRAIQVYEYEYDLILNPDYNTRSHTQWYLFRVGNTRKGPTYRFNILNMVKPTSVYNEGMRPLQYSTIDASVHGIGWKRCGNKIMYYQNGIRNKDVISTNYYTLTFTITFDYDCDVVHFSHCYPYNYTELQKDLQELEKDPNVARRFRRRKLCETLAGNACDLITITSFCSDPAALRGRRAIVITARVHPGESNASWVMKGMLEYLTGPSLDARILRDNFVFKIVPMLNPDGVIVGNYRCSLAGQDLNRLWDDPSRKMHPTIFFTKSMIRHLLNDRDVILYIDIHGHSRKKNVFMYGNSEGSSIREKIFPGLLCRNSDCFSFDDCCFKVQKCKESTARVVAYRELSIVNSFTLEASFCGADFGPLADQHFTTRHLEEMGYMICDAILDFCDPDQTKVLQVVRELQLLFPDDGNSDDVSDSEEDSAAVARLRRRKTSTGKKAKREKTKKKRSSNDGRTQDCRTVPVSVPNRASWHLHDGDRKPEIYQDADGWGGVPGRDPSVDVGSRAIDRNNNTGLVRRGRKKKRKDKGSGRGYVEEYPGPASQASRSSGDLRPVAVFPPLGNVRRQRADGRTAP